MNSAKWMYSIMAGILFVVIASPQMFSVTQRFIANPLKQVFVKNGVPTLMGLAVHGVVYVLLVRLLMG